MSPLSWFYRSTPDITDHALAGILAKLDFFPHLSFDPILSGLIFGQNRVFFLVREVFDVSGVDLETLKGKLFLCKFPACFIKTAFS